MHIFGLVYGFVKDATDFEGLFTSFDGGCFRQTQEQEVSTDLLRLLKQSAAHQNATQHSSLNANSIINSDESETKQKMAGKIQAGNQELVVFSLAIIFLILVLAIIFLLIFVLVVLRDGFDRVLLQLMIRIRSVIRIPESGILQSEMSDTDNNDIRINKFSGRM